MSTIEDDIDNQIDGPTENDPFISNIELNIVPVNEKQELNDRVEMIDPFSLVDEIEKRFQVSKRNK
jgi:hypothetical protein